MRTKTIAASPMLLMSLCLGTPAGRAAESANDSLQKGLLEEEANQNLNAAVQAYQSVLKRFDDERKTAGVATFRLGECYRKQGLTNEALTQFERVVRDFSDQEPLLRLSSKYLAQAGRTSPSARTSAGSIASNQPPADGEQTNLLKEEISLVQQQIEAVQRAVQNGKATSNDLVTLQRELIELKRKLPENTPAPQQRALIEQEMQYAEQLLAECRKKIEVGQAAPADEIPFKRDVLKLKRELLAAQGTGQAQFQTRLQSIVKRADSEGVGLDEESMEIQRIQEIIKNSPDLINAPAATGASANAVAPLHRAAGKGQLAVARFLLDNHAEINAVSIDGQEKTALHVAAEAGHKAMVELLLDRGAELDARDKSGNTPLHTAARRGFQAVAQVLLASGADVNAKDVRGGTPLMSAVNSAQKGIMELLLANKADINAQDSNGFTALMYTVIIKRPDVVKLLLSSKPKVNLESNPGPGTLNGTSALSQSVIQEASAITGLLLEQGADPNVQGISAQMPVGTKYRMPVLHAAAKKGDVGLIREFIKHGADPNLLDGVGRTALHYAVAADSPSATQALLGAGANPNVEDAQGYTPLLLAIYGNVDVPGNENRNRAALAKDLLGKGAKVNAQNRDGLTPLLAAVSGGANELVELLIASGADPNVKTVEGFTALHVAASSGYSDIVRFLLTKGAELNAQDASGNTPLHYAAFKDQKAAAVLLVEKGAKLDLVNRDGQTPATMITDARYLSSQGRWGIPVKNPGMLGGNINLDPPRSEMLKLLTGRTAKLEKD